MSDALIFDGVSKAYGRHQALDSLTCRFPRGRISALLGPNGAGKTTAFSLVAGFLQPDRGAIDILGTGPFDPWTLKGRLGILPQDAELPDRHTPRELLVHLGRLQGLDASTARVQAAEKIDLVQLHDRADHAIRTLSHGMHRRVAVATALIGKPELVLLDEPTAGLDPVQAHGLRAALHRIEDTTLIVSSHQLDALERLCDWVVMLHHGRCVSEGPIDEVTGRATEIHWHLVGDLDLAPLRRALPSHDFTLDGSLLTQRAPPDTADASSVVLLSLLAAQEIGIRSVRRGSSLEETFLQRTRDVQGS